MMTLAYSFHNFPRNYAAAAAFGETLRFEAIKFLIIFRESAENFRALCWPRRKRNRRCNFFLGKYLAEQEPKGVSWAFEQKEDRKKGRGERRQTFMLHA